MFTDPGEEVKFNVGGALHYLVAACVGSGEVRPNLNPGEATMKVTLVGHSQVPRNLEIADADVRIFVHPARMLKLLMIIPYCRQCITGSTTSQFIGSAVTT